MVQIIKHDLEFILKQIKIAEAHAAGGDLAALVAGYNGNDGLTQAHLLPYGLRTVDGSYNNLLPGRERWGASGESFPDLSGANYINDADGDTFAPGGPPITNTDYANLGNVADADPRLISNLVVDQTAGNPAAIVAALQHAGVAASDIMSALTEITTIYGAIKADLAVANAAVLSAETRAAAAQTVAYSTGLEADIAAADAAAQQVADALATFEAVRAPLKTALDGYGVEIEGVTLVIPNVAPDEGLSSPYNGWMTIFGQFFDHGLDLVAKGGNGTVYVPLSPDDPLYVPGARTNFMALTRITVDAGPDGQLGTADDVSQGKNMTTPWVDQNQTYGSTASKQIFMREYVAGPDGLPIATGHLLEGSTGGAGGGHGGLATWGDIKAQAREVLGINLTDDDVGNIPLIASDQYGNFIRGANGYPQVVVGLGADGLLGTADDVLLEGDPTANGGLGVDLPPTTLRTGHAFLDDIARNAAPGGVFDPDGPAGPLGETLVQADADDVAGNAIATDYRGRATAYDDELLDAHYIAGDGRANENIALTAVHHVFHSEHNRLVEATKTVALESNDLAFLNEWLLVDVAEIPADAAGIAALVWDGERLFQAARFTTEMEYQHLVFEEFGRMIQPDIDPFVFEPSADINPNIAAEFAHVVYRFGHSMLREDIARINIGPDGTPVQDDLTLFSGFLNPLEFASAGDADAAAGAIIRGMSRQVGSEIDEFVTDVLRNQLLGVPLDLATINIARGRDVGTPPLNAAREKFFNETGDTLLKPYESWADFALNLKNPASVINFIAAYGTHETITSATTAEGKRAAATALVLGDTDGAGPIEAPADRLDFLNAEGIYAGGKLGGLNDVDFWVGGLAEKKMAFGGMLGSTFAFTFQMTMENLQDADRFYYLSRTQGLNLLNELENNTFAELVMRNTDLGNPGQTTLPGNLFSAFAMPTLEMDQRLQLDADPVQDDPILQAFSALVERRDANNDGVSEYIRVNSNEHFTIGGTENADVIVAGGGDDAVWGKGGDDTIEAGYGVDKVFAGDGDDIITNSGTDIGEADFLHGNAGNDVIHGGSGLSLLFGNEGSDFIVTGPDGKEAFAGTGNDFVLGGTGGDFLLGNEGDDWLEGGQRFDTLAGENSELFFNSSIIGHDVLNGGSGDVDYDGESGDDIMFQNVEGIQRSNGMAGFDWAVHKGDSSAANSDLGIPIFETQEAFILRDRFDLVEGLSGWNKDDVLTGRVTAVNTRPELEGTAAIPAADSLLDSYSNDLLEKNVDLVDGLRELVAHLARETVTVAGRTEQIVMRTNDASDILLGGGGSDVITGLAGNDIIDGDRWMNVRIRIVKDGVAYTADEMGGKVYREVDYVNGAPVTGAAEQFGGKTLTELMFSRTLNPGQLSIVREIVEGDVGNTGVDTAVYRDVLANYSFALNGDGSITVTHTAVDPTPEGGDGAEFDAASDGVDRLFNVEKLRFSDGNGGTVDYFINQLPFPATGAPVINDLTPTEGQPLTVNTSAIQDINGVGAFSYQWQVSEDGGTTWSNLLLNANGASFTPNEGILGVGSQVGDRLRVVVSFTDGIGTRETVVSGPTGVVGDLWNRGLFTGDTFNGTAGDDIANGWSGIFGLGAADFLNGNGGNDQLNGSGGNDVLNGGTGSDRLDGGAGTDTAVFAGTPSTFALGSIGTSFVVTDLAGDQGVDTLSTIETLRFGATDFQVVVGSTGNDGAINGTQLSRAVFGLAGNDTINAGAGVDLVVGGTGNDTINAGDDNDLVYWTAGDGRDRIDGAGGVDTVKLIGDASAETYRIYSRDAAIAAGISGLNANTEIVVTRNGTDNAAVVAELDNVEEIVINGMGGGDTFTPIGTFAGTSLLTSTITLEGGAGNDTLDMSALTSEHRVVFRSNGGQDTIVGNLRPQDVVEVAEGTDPAGYAAISATTVSNGTNSISHAGGTIVLTPSSRHDDDIDVHDGGENDYTSAAPSGPAAAAMTVAGNRHANDLRGDSGADNISGGGGNDVIRGLWGSDLLRGNVGDDILIGGSGNDRLGGGGGDDLLFGGAGNDRLWGGAGRDVFVFDSDDQVMDFGIGEDSIYLGGRGITAANFADHVEILRENAHTKVVVDGDTMLLLNTPFASLTIDSFLLDQADGVGAPASAGSPLLDAVRGELSAAAQQRAAVSAQTSFAALDSAAFDGMPAGPLDVADCQPVRQNFDFITGGMNQADGVFNVCLV